MTDNLKPKKTVTSKQPAVPTKIAKGRLANKAIKNGVPVKITGRKKRS